YNADGNVIRLIASDNKAIRDYIPKIMESPFVTEIVTDTGLKEKISIGGSKSDPSRVVAWAFTERDGTLFHIVADLSFSFAVGNKDILMNVAKSFGFEKSEAVCGK
ncbi:MAG TPA: hypothetical protein VHR42_00955, partial [Clostridia bacterium]|nr:hypothetical protein [Clostridia bacterium]